MSHQVIIGDPNTLHLQKLSARADTTAKSARLLSTQRDSFLTALCTRSAPTCQQIRNEKPAIYIFKRKNQKFCAANRPDTLHYATKLPHPPDTPPHPRAFLPGSAALRHSPDYLMRFCACILPTFIAAYIPGSAPIPQIEEPNASTRFFHGVPNNIRTHAFPHAKKQYNTPT